MNGWGSRIEGEWEKYPGWKSPGLPCPPGMPGVGVPGTHQGCHYISYSWIDIFWVEVFFGVQGNFFTGDLGYHGGDGAALDNDAA